MSEYKKFSKKLYDENDDLAKKIAVDFLLSTGLYSIDIPIEEQEEKFKKQDFEIKFNKNNRNIKIEVERKKVWKKEADWEGYSTIDVPTRKNKSESDLFIMVNNNCNTIAVVPMKKILSSKISNKKTIYTSNESFFNVELSEFKFYYKNNDNWSRIEI